MRKDEEVVIIVEGKTSEKFEKYKSGILEIFSKYDWYDLLSCISYGYFYLDIIRFLIVRYKDKRYIGILSDKAATLQPGLMCRITNNEDDNAKDFCSDFSLHVVAPFARRYLSNIFLYSLK